MVNNPNYFNDLIPNSNTTGVIGGSNSEIHFKGTLCAYLHFEYKAMIVQIKDVPRIKSNPHNGFTLIPFNDVRFK